MNTKRKATTFGLIVVGTAAYAALSTYKKQQAMLKDAVGRWHTITVNRPIDEVAVDGMLPTPLTDIADMIAVELRPAPDEKGTEIAVLIKESSELPSREALRKVRAALRKTQMLLETGEELSPDKPGSTKPTVWNAPLRYMIKNRYGEGRL